MRLLHGYKASIRLGFAALFLSVSIPLIIAASAGGARGESQSDRSELVEVPAPPAPAYNVALMGTRSGISVIDSTLGVHKLWSGAEVRKLVPTPSGWFALSGAGILFSADGTHWETRNEGLPVKTIKVLREGVKDFEQQVQELKDLAADPTRPDILVTATKDAIYLSRDAGLSWKSLGLPVITNGVKAVAVAPLDGTTVFASSGIYGLYARNADLPSSKWSPVSDGLLNMDTSSYTDEISSILVIPPQSPDAHPEVFIAQGFKQALYRLDWTARRCVPLLRYDEPIGMLDGLTLEVGHGASGAEERRLVWSRHGGMVRMNISADEALPQAADELVQRFQAASRATGEALFSYAPLSRGPTVENAATPSHLAAGPVYSELWLNEDPAVEAQSVRRQRQAKARGHEGIYLPGGHLTNEAQLLRYEKIIEDYGLDAIVVDMKDDMGRLRYKSDDEVVSALAQVSNPADLSTFLPRFKEKGVWTIARIVVFKDKNLASRAGGKYAVWDAGTKSPWQGYRLETKKIPDPQNEGAEIEETEQVYYAENWVDPYSEEVWDYVARISAELVQKGFDEIQYDYIRFPTDGINLNKATYRWQDKGMDKESALISFLRHMRANVDAPISVDIYGANGWYRTGARTGQEVETLAHWVDIICPMYYPSHFEQTFLAQKPAAERPWRIYHIGTWRNHFIARGDVLIRPFAQAFYLNVSYDRQYYGAQYIRRQVDGIREAGSPGLIYWNNGGQYKDLVAKPKEKEEGESVAVEPVSQDPVTAVAD